MHYEKKKKKKLTVERKLNIMLKRLMSLNIFLTFELLRLRLKKKKIMKKKEQSNCI